MKQKVLKNVWLRTAMIVAVVTTAFAGTAQATEHTVTKAAFPQTYGTFNGYISYTSSGSGIEFACLKVNTGGSLTLTALHGSKITAVTYRNTAGNATTYTINGGASTQIVGEGNITFTSTEGVTEVVLNNTGKGKKPLLFDEIAVTYIPATPQYVVTARTNNADWGTVTVDGNLIVATPAAGFAYAEGEAAYTVLEGTATVAHSENEFIVEASTNCIVRVNFAPKAEVYEIDFEQVLVNYELLWTIEGVERTSKYENQYHHAGVFSGKVNSETAKFEFNNEIEYPGTLSCFVRNTGSSCSGSWYVQVKQEGGEWATVKDANDLDITQAVTGSYQEFSVDLSAYTNAYVRLCYEGEDTHCRIDDISLTTLPKLVAPEIAVAEMFEGESTTATITCGSDDATIMYRYQVEGEEWTEWAEYTAALTITATTTIEAKAVRNTVETEVVSKTATKVDVAPVVVNIAWIGYSTMYYSDKNLQVPSGVTATTYKVTNKLEKSKTYAAGDVIPAGEAVVLQGSEGAHYFGVVEGDLSGDKDANNALKGTDTSATTTDGTYYYALSLNSSNELSSVGFYWMVAGGGAFTCGAHKAYLALNKTFAELAGGGVKGFISLFEEDDATGIENLNVDLNEGAIYNLAGQRMNKMQKGINIVNGKKILK